MSLSTAGDLPCDGISPSRGSVTKCALGPLILFLIFDLESTSAFAGEAQNWRLGQNGV